MWCSIFILRYQTFPILENQEISIYLFSFYIYIRKSIYLVKVILIEVKSWPMKALPVNKIYIVIIVIKDAYVMTMTPRLGDGEHWHL